MSSTCERSKIRWCPYLCADFLGTFASALEQSNLCVDFLCTFMSVLEQSNLCADFLSTFMSAFKLTILYSIFQEWSHEDAQKVHMYTGLLEC